jgi:UDP-N-acetylmuramate dehydrogenase
VTHVPTTSSLAERTTLRVGGPAAAWTVALTEDDLVASVLAADAVGTPVLLLGGGSNLVVADAGFPGTVIEIATRGIDVVVAGDHVALRASAGESWDDVVAHAVANGWAGIEALSGIPGRVGATPIQNVGAYGQDVSQVVSTVRVLDRSDGLVRDLDGRDCGFGYRMSRFKAEPGRWVVLAVTMRLTPSGRGTVRYAELAHDLGVTVADAAPVSAIRASVLALRARKGMVLDDSDPDTWSAGSFFTNPVVDDAVARTIPDACPRYPSAFGTKLSAAWLIENAGIGKGFALPGRPRAAISAKHTLALTNRGGATANEVLDLARAVRAAVQGRFGVDLEVEPTLVGLAL